MIEKLFFPATWLMTRLSLNNKMRTLFAFVVIMLVGVLYAAAEKIHSATVLDTLLVLLILWLYSFGGYYLNARRSIDELMAMTDKAANGDMNARALTFGQDELSHIGESMNTMMASIKHHHALLSEYKSAVDKSTLVIKIDTKGKITYANQAYRRLSGYNTLEKLIGKPYTVLYAEDAATQHMRTFWEVISTKKTFRSVFEQKGKEGEHFFVESTTVPILDGDGEITEYISIMHDISALKQHERELELQLYRDALTALPNRNALLKAMSISKECKLMLLNIDNFSAVNTIYGESVGNDVLCKVAEHLKRLITNEHLQLFKLSSDEFAILADEFITEAFFHEDLVMISHALNPLKLLLSEHEVTIRVSIGAVIAARQQGSRSLMTMADIALKKAKSRPKSYYFYSEEVDTSLQLEHNLETLEQLENAIKNETIIGHYQPIYNVKTKRVDKFETLMRLVDDKGEIHYPTEFIHVAKGARLYAKLTRQIVLQTIGKALENPDIVFTVNISIEDITDTRTSEFILEHLRSSRCAEQIVFEVVESEEIDNNKDVKLFFNELKKAGASIAIDDFGSGYSNYAYMFDMGVDLIKIDGSLIINIENDINKQRITASIINMAHDLDLKTVIEFVGNKEVFDLVVAMGADFIQGVYIGSAAAQLQFNTPRVTV